MRYARRWLGWLLVAVALLALAPPGANAQGGAALDAKKLEAIRSEMERGQAKFVAGDYEAAARIFEAGLATHSYAAFSFNAGVCFQKLGRVDQALASFREYLRLDPDAPDAADVKERIKKLEAARPAPAAPDLDAGAGDGAVPDGGAVAPPGPDLSGIAANTKSLILVETEPSGAPIRLYKKSRPTAAPFAVGAGNDGWVEVAQRTAPMSLSLDVGDYHLVVEKFRDFNPTDTEIRIEAGRVFHFRANLSQGRFMGYLRVLSNVEGAVIRLDDDRRAKKPWGRTPHAELVARGEHDLLVEAPGFEPLRRKIRVGQAQQVDVEVELVRVGYGFLHVDGNAPELKVELDGKPAGVWKAGQAPLSVRLPAGRHRLVMRASGYKTYEGDVDVPRGLVLPVHAEMIPTYPRGAAWTQAIIGAALLGTGAYLGIRSNDLHAELEADRKAGVLEPDDDRADRGRLFAIGADAAFALGGVLAALATYNFIKDPYPDSGRKTERPREFGATAPPPRSAPPPPQARGPDIGFGLSASGGAITFGGSF